MVAPVKASTVVRITKLETLAADIAERVASSAADQMVSSGQFRLGQETDDCTVVDITVTRCRRAGWRSACR